MSKNPLLLGWLMDTKDDCFPYYLSKLEFLQMYGKQCSNHEGTCKSAKTEKECNVKRTLKCTYSEGECVKVIDSICNYYDADGKIKENEWGEEQIIYMDELYKTAVNVQFGEFMLGKDYNKTVKTNAFQMISEKFNHVNYSSSDDTGCVNSIKTILMSNLDFMQELVKMREKAYNNMAKEHSQPFIFTPSIKNSELALYVFELLKTKKCGGYNTIFSHNKSDDTKIYEILTKKGVCFEEEFENDKSSSFFNLGNFDKEDFEYKDGVSISSFVWNLQKTVFKTVKTSFMSLGNIVLTIPKLIMKSLYSGSSTVKTIVTIGLILFASIIMIGGVVYLGPASLSTAVVSYMPNSLAFTGASFNIFSFLSPVMGQLRLLLDMLNSVFCSISQFFKFDIITSFIAKEIHGFIHSVSDIGNSVYGQIIMFFLGVDTAVKNLNLLKMSVEFIQRALRMFSIDLFLSPLSMFTNSMQCSTASVKQKLTGVLSTFFASAQQGIDSTGLSTLFDALAMNVEYMISIFNYSDTFVYLKTFLNAAPAFSLSKLTEYLGVLAAIIITFFNNITGLSLDITNNLYKNISSDIYRLFTYFMSFEYKAIGTQFVSNGGQLLAAGGQYVVNGKNNILAAGGQVLSNGGQVLSNGGQLITAGGQYIVNGKNNVLAKGGQLMANGGQLLAAGGQYVVDGKNNVVAKGGQLLAAGGQYIVNGKDQVVAKGGQLITDGGKLAANGAQYLNPTKGVQIINGGNADAIQRLGNGNIIVNRDFYEKMNDTRIDIMNNQLLNDYNEPGNFTKYIPQSAEDVAAGLYRTEITPGNIQRWNYTKMGLKIGLVALALIGSKLLYDRYKSRTLKNKTAAATPRNSLVVKDSSPKKTLSNASSPYSRGSNSEVNGKYRRCPNGKHRNKTSKKCNPVK